MINSSYLESELIWKDLKLRAPELAKDSELSFQKNGLALIGTIRRDGSPRISPVEVFLLPEDIMFGMMKNSRKALDLLRDSRCTLHNTVSDPNGSEVECKMYGRAIAGQEGMKERYRSAYASRWGRDPPQSFPAYVFSMDLDKLALIRYDTERNLMHVKKWTKEGGSREYSRKYP